jgi:site-specific recombinase XerC
MMYKATGNLRAIQILLGHLEIENTVRYLGVNVEDAFMLAALPEAAGTVCLRLVSDRQLSSCDMP